MKNYFSENRLVFMGMEGGPSGTPEAAEAAKVSPETTASLSFKFLKLGKNFDANQLQTAAKNFVNKEPNQLNRINKIKSYLQQNIPDFNSHAKGKLADQAQEIASKMESGINAIAFSPIKKLDKMVKAYNKDKNKERGNA